MTQAIFLKLLVLSFLYLPVVRGKVTIAMVR